MKNCKKRSWDLTQALLTLYFLFPVPIDRSSKLLSASSRPPLVAAVLVKDDVLDSNPGWNLWVVDRRPLLETSRLDRFSLGSPEELGLLLDTTGLFEVLPLRELRPLSESGCCKEGRRKRMWSDWESGCKNDFMEKRTRKICRRLHITTRNYSPHPWKMAHHLKICAWCAHHANHALCHSF